MPEVLRRDGVDLAYETAGSGDPPIVFLHGWACDRSFFAPEFDHFAGQHAVATIDLRGHGASGHPEPVAGTYEVGPNADDVLAVSEAAGLQQPVLVGHSLGALIALECASRPGAIRAAVMSTPHPS